MDSSLTSLVTSFPVVIGTVAVVGFLVQRAVRAKTNRKLDEAFRLSLPASSAGSALTSAAAPRTAAQAVPAAPGAAPSDERDVRRLRRGILFLVLASAAVAARQAYFSRFTGDMNEMMRLAFDPEAQSSARLVGTGSLLLAGAFGVAGIAQLVTGRRPLSGAASVTGPVVLVAGLFLAYRGLEYSRCRSSCQVDCDAEAQRGNPFAAFGARNDVGRALCASRVSECFASCRFP